MKNFVWIEFHSQRKVDCTILHQTNKLLFYDITGLVAQIKIYSSFDWTFLQQQKENAYTYKRMHTEKRVQ